MPSILTHVLLSSIKALELSGCPANTETETVSWHGEGAALLSVPMRAFRRTNRQCMSKTTDPWLLLRRVRGPVQEKVMAQIEKAPKPAAKPAAAKPAASPAAQGTEGGAAAAAAKEPEADPVETALGRYGIIMSNSWAPEKK